MARTAQILDFAEAKATETLELLRESYDDYYERLLKVVTALIGAGGALGAFALSKTSADYPIVASIEALAVMWIGVALRTTIAGAMSRDLSPGNGPKNILAYFDARMTEQDGATRRREDMALRITREAELELQQRRIRDYIDACANRADVLDLAYIGAALAAMVAVVFFSVLNALT